MTRLFCILWCAFGGIAAGAQPYQIQHLEPPSWWVGMKNHDLQLMVHGESVGTSQPHIDYKGVTLRTVEKTGNPNYLFLNLSIAADTRPGSFDIVFKRDGRLAGKVAYSLAAREKGSSARRGFDASDVIYLIVPDRFANGDAGNDSQAQLLEKADRPNPVSRHGGDIRGMRDHLRYVRDMGFTMIWPTPLLENNQPDYSYHGYSQTNHYLIDRRFGTNEEFREFVAAARQHGLGVIQDVVLNHIGTGHWWMNDLPAADWLNFQAGFVPTNNQHTTVQDPHASPEDLKMFVDGWFVPTMPDLNQRNPLVARYLIQNAIWWIEYAGLSGIREDTYSYADKTFLRRWSEAILHEYPNFNIVGEEMNSHPHIVAYWQKGVRNRDGYQSGLPSLMDFPLSDLIAPALTSEEGSDSGLIKLYEMIGSDFVYADPMKLVVFPDNHDRPRIFSVLGENVDLLKSSLLFALTTRGIPQIFYGTEVLIESPRIRDDGLLRADMPGGWAGDPTSAFTGAGLSDRQLDVQRFLRKLLQWRRSSPAITKGKLMHYIPERGVYVYFRYLPDQLVMVVINKSKEDQLLDPTRFKTMLGSKRAGRNVITEEQVRLDGPLKLRAMTSMAIEF